MTYEPTQARRIAEGLCKDCGAARGADGTTRFCRPCANAHSKRQAARKARLREQWAANGAACNTCGSALPVPSKYKNCERCRERARKYHHNYSRERRERYRGSGFCIRGCATPITHSSTYCRDHWLENGLSRYGFARDQYDAMWAKLETQGFRCYYTGVELVPGVNASLDHRMPISRGGDPCDMGNTVWCDRLINAFKNDLTESEFVERCRLVVSRIG